MSKDILIDIEKAEKLHKGVMDSINEGKIELESVAKEKKSIDSAILKSQKELEKVDKKIKTENKKIDKKISDLEVVSSKIDEVNKTLDEVLDRINVGEKELAQINISKKSVEVDKMKRIKTLDSKIEKKEERFNEVVDEIAVVQSKGLDDIDALNINIKVIKEKNRNCEKVLKSLEPEIIKQEDLIKANEVVIEDLKKSISDLQEKCKKKNEKKLKIGEEIKVIEAELLEFVGKQKVEEKKLEAIIKKGGILAAREDYVKNQEEYLKDQFKRLGLKYQPYA